jgi:hypothetical protein
MSNLFQDISNNKSSLNVLSNDINKLIKYVELLLSDKSNTLGLDINFSEYNGLIPGTISNLNPFNTFLSGERSHSQHIYMENIDVNNNNSAESHYLTLADINQNIFSNKNNKEFSTSYGLFENEEFPFPSDIFDQLYFAGLGGLGIYILYRFMEKSK